MMKVIKRRLVDGIIEENLIHQLDKAKKLAQSQKIEDTKAITDENSQTDEENININEAEIKNIYVSSIVEK